MEKNDDAGFKTVIDDTEPVKNNFTIQQTPDFKEEGFLAKLKSHIGKIIIIVLLVVCLAGIAYLSGEIASTKTSLAEISKKTEGVDIKALKAQISEFEAKIEGLKKENDSLKTELTNIKEEMDKLKSAKKPAQAQTQKQTKPTKSIKR
ncbi:MAG TPA: hypothetical protein PKW07_08780 [Syntrophorhabdaceae bacterium]|mgnify:CR=1 FL=1|nr:hypothetical protein [Syntrophorhabdaceae bacterium]